MPNLNDQRQKRESDARRLANQPGVIRLNCCHACGAANPTTTADPHPERCASCGTALQPPASWEGKTPSPWR